MDFIIDLAITWWQITLVTLIVLVGWVINLFNKHDKPLVHFKYVDFPTMKPIRIPTKDMGFWGAVWLWIMGTRTWEIVKDFRYELNGQQYVIPKGFVFDGASVPKFLATWLSPVGVLLLGGLVHDYMYSKAGLLKVTGKLEPVNQEEADKIFRNINIEVNGFWVMNYLAYYALRLFGFIAWNNHRKKD